jgi:BirA family biotin operon repressor/biotin-[acetyl-CoA-carboxylase] ligase
MAGREPLDAAVLQDLLGPRWQRVATVAETTSTNADLLHDVSAPDRSVLIAELQTAGRGRLDRTWTSPAGAGLTFSVLLRPDVALQHWGWLPLLAGVALHDAVTSATRVPASLKWPNDLLVGPDARKAAGILVQSGTDVVVIGIGLNVSTTADELPVTEATSLALAGAADVDRTALLVEILARLDARCAQWADCGGDAEACGLAEAYRQACGTIAQEVVVSTGADPIQGTAVDVDAAGRLVVDTADGPHSIAAGDVQHVRTD